MTHWQRIADSTVDISRRTTNDTLACLNVGPGQVFHGLQTPRCSQSSSNKSTVSTFDDDTALILETGNAFGNEGLNQQRNNVSNTSSFMSESADGGDTMRVFECLMQKAGAGDFEEHDRSHEMQIAATANTSLNSTNMEVTDLILEESVDVVRRIAHAHQRSDESTPSTEAVNQNSTFVVESPHQNAALGDHVADELMQRCVVAMDIGNETINLVTSETSFCAGDKLNTSQICSTHPIDRNEARCCLLVVTVFSVQILLQTPQLLSKLKREQLLPSDLCPDVITILIKMFRAKGSLKEATDKTGTINLFTTPDKSMVSMRQEIADRSDASEVNTALARDEDMDVTVVDEKNSLLQDVASSTVPHDSMEDVQEQSYPVQAESHDKTAAFAETMRTLDGNVENSMVSVDRRSSTTICSYNESLNEANITRRDVSIMQIGSRFRPSTSSRDDTILSLRSLRDETICLSERIMFDSQSLQV
ncbi:hypothetical protein OSTOST_21715 [Ostertagia ostertagi]